MKLELRQTFQIESARFLPNLPDGHPCSQMHGHSFKITLIWRGSKDPKVGWVHDYHSITTQIQPILSRLDHKVLNQVEGLENPTSENLCIYLFEHIQKWLPEIHQVIVSETPNTECRYPITS